MINKTELTTGDPDRFRKWAKHLGISVLKIAGISALVAYDDPAKLYWLGMNMGSDLPAPEDQTRAGNSEYLRKQFPDNRECFIPPGLALCQNCGKPFGEHVTPHNNCPKHGK